MNNKILKIGVSAALTRGRSIHLDTFERAVDLATKYIFDDRRVSLIWADDLATYEGGKRAATELVISGVDIVVGHYASASAKGALAVYGEACIPLLMPAATADSLTQSYKFGFRVCGKDSDLVKFIVEVLTRKQVKRILLQKDESFHGQVVFDCLSKMLVNKVEVITSYEEGLLMVSDIIFVGTYTNSICFVNELEKNKKRNYNVYLTDDALHPSLISDLKTAMGVFIFGYKSPHDVISAKMCVEQYRR
ncbi:MAG: amino acid ABC transporter substrate-binding protein, partial [Flavobacterium sp.]